MHAHYYRAPAVPRGVYPHDAADGRLPIPLVNIFLKSRLPILRAPTDAVDAARLYQAAE